MTITRGRLPGFVAEMWVIASRVGRLRAPRFMVAELSRMWIGCENNRRAARTAPQMHYRHRRLTGSVQENSDRDSMAVWRRHRKDIERLFRAAAFWLAEPSRRFKSDRALKTAVRGGVPVNARSSWSSIHTSPALSRANFRFCIRPRPSFGRRRTPEASLQIFKIKRHLFRRTCAKGFAGRIFLWQRGFQFVEMKNHIHADPDKAIILVPRMTTAFRDSSAAVDRLPSSSRRCRQHRLTAARRCTSASVLRPKVFIHRIVSGQQIFNRQFFASLDRPQRVDEDATAVFDRLAVRRAGVVQPS
jgi:hypothetical protein